MNQILVHDTYGYMVHNVSIEVFRREAKHASAFIDLSNKSSIIRRYEFTGLKDQLKSIF
jgi:hypothetical protein